MWPTLELESLLDLIQSHAGLNHCSGYLNYLNLRDIGFPYFNRLKRQIPPHVKNRMAGHTKSHKIFRLVVASFFEVMDVHPLIRSVATTGTGVVISFKNYFSNAIPFGLWWALWIPQSGIADSRAQDQFLSYWQLRSLG